MLLRFEVSNHRSILEPVELSMIAVDKDRLSVRSVESLSEGVLTVAGIYGPNASGKSNVIEALAWLSIAIRRSLRTWDKFIPREPFRFDRGPSTASTYEVEMMINEVRYAYRIELNNSEVLFEGLYNYPERRRRILFEREGTEVRFRRGLGALSGVRELLTPTTLVLSAAMRFDEYEVEPFARSLASFGILIPPRRTSVPGLLRAAMLGIHSTGRLFEEQGSSMQQPLFEELRYAPLESRESALALLRFADLGIDDVQISEFDIDESKETRRTGAYPRKQLRFIHRVLGEELAFDLEEESAGTQMWFSLIGPTLSALVRGQILIFDEIDASLHPRLSARLLELFQDPKTNPRGAQLIFTTHDTSLLNHLNRDEVWLTEKGENGATTLTALAEYGGDKVRRSLNLERAYLQGRFGAVPELDQFTLRQALGLFSTSG